MAKKPASVTDQLRKTITDRATSGIESRYALSQRTGVGESVLSRFVAGGPLASDTLDKLCEALDLVLKPKRRRKDR